MKMPDKSISSQRFLLGQNEAFLLVLEGIEKE